jgi:hypothetical protein
LNKIKKWKPNRLSILFSGGCDSRRAAIDGTFQVSSAGSAGFGAVLARRRRPLASSFSLHSKNGRPTTRRRNAQEKQSSHQNKTLRDLSKVSFFKKIKRKILLLLLGPFSSRSHFLVIKFPRRKKVFWHTWFLYNAL